MPSKWNDGVVHVSRPFGRVSIDGRTLRAWGTVPLLSRTGLRFLKREVTIDPERPVFHYRPMDSLYIPTVGGGWFRTSITNVERRLGEMGVSIEVGKPPKGRTANPFE
jgi:hypothetical protein